MPSVFETVPTANAIPIAFASKANWDAIRKTLSAEGQKFAAASGFAAKPGKCLLVPAPDGALSQVIFGIEDEAAKSRDPFRVGALPGLLPAGTYRFANAPHDARLAALAFALGSYRFARYRKVDKPEVRLVPPDGVDAAELARMADAAFLARDLINTPSNDMGPAELEAAARDVATRFGA
jgi:leucyl aminopeptidase